MDFARLGNAIREARKDKGWTQMDLKNRVGCSQSQVSELEQGIRNSVSREVLIDIARNLGVNLADYETPEPAAALPEDSEFAYCANQNCPAARPFVINGKVHIKPHIVPFSSGVKKCEFCGDVLAPRCRQLDCNHPVNPGFFCRGCGKAYIEVPGEIANPANAEIKARQVDEFKRQFQA